MQKLVIVFFITVSTLFAASPKTVIHNSKTDFERGTLNNVTIKHDGTLKMAPVKTRIMGHRCPICLVHGRGFKR